MNATKRDIYRAFEHAVKFSPACDDKCRQLQTFRVLEQGGGGQLTAANFGATFCDRNKPYFWSRAWHNSGYKEKIMFDFPVLSIIETNYNIERPLDFRGARCYDFNISVLDKYTADCEKGKCSGCNGRTINEIYEHTETLLFASLQFLSGLIEATLPDGTTGIFNRAMLDAWKAAGYISDYDQGATIGDTLTARTKNASAYKASIPAEGLYGNSISLTMCLTPCEETQYNFNNPDFVDISRVSGCTNCGA